MYNKAYLIVTTMLITLLLSACTCRKNSKIEKLSSLVSTTQSGYKTFTEEDWVYCDNKLDQILSGINKCAQELTKEDNEFIEKQKGVYNKVKIKWQIENLKLLKQKKENEEPN